MQIWVIFKSLRLFREKRSEKIEIWKMLGKIQIKKCTVSFGPCGLVLEQFDLKVGQNRDFGVFEIFGPNRIFGGPVATCR